MEQPILAGRPNQSDEEVFEQEAPIDIEDQCRSIVDRLSTLAQEQVTSKNFIEERWLENMRAYHGFYDPSTETALKDAKQSRAFIKITGAKTRALKARLFDLIFPTDDRNWGIGPTPVPKLSKEVREAEAIARDAADRANRAAASGNPEMEQAAIEVGNDQAGRAQAAKQEVAAMRKASDLMQEEMDDQLVESQYPQECRKLIDDGAKLGTGILKGPMVNLSTRGRWLPSDGGFELRQSQDPQPRMKRVDPWSFFPDMSARNIEEAEFTFERYLWSKKQLRKMVKTHGFNANAVRRLLDENSSSTTLANMPTGMSYLSQLRSISRDEALPIKGRMVGWEYHGPLECTEVATLLRAVGEEEAAQEYERRDDPLDEMNVVAFFCNGELLKIAPEYPLDSGETLYSVFNVVEAEGCIFGYGVPHLIDSTQAALNASWRMGLDNSAFSVKPQSVMDKDQIQPADGDWNMSPGKLWLRVKGGTQSDGKIPIEFFNVPNNMEEIVMIIRLCMEFVDLESGIPMPQQGEQGAHTTQTVGGMAILQNAANVVFRAVVKNFDDGIITPTMRRLYDWNMQHNPRNEIKGDMQVDARGTSVLLVKEVQAQNLMVIITGLMADPRFQTMLKPYEAITKLFQSMMIKPDDILVSEEDYQEAMRQAQEQGPPPDPVIINAQSRIEAAQIQAKSRETSDETSLMIEQIRQRTALVDLASRENLSLEELRGKLGIEKEKIASGERKMAFEAGVEKSMADEARARGEQPTGSGGFISAGSKPNGGN